MSNDYLSLMDSADKSLTKDQSGATKSVNPYLTMMDAGQQQQESKFRASTSLAIEANPDQVATDKRTAEFLGTQPMAVETLRDEAQRAAKLKEIDQNTQDTPTLRQQYTDADFAKLAHDDSGALSGIEKVMGYLGNAAKYITSAPGQETGLLRDVGAAGMQSMRQLSALNRIVASPLADVEDAINGLTGAGQGPLRSWEQKAGAGAQYFGQQSKQIGSTWDPDSLPAQIFGGGTSAGVTSMVQTMGTGVAASWLLGPEVGIPVTLAAMALGQGSETFQSDKEKGVGTYKSMLHGAEDATAEYVTEKYLGIAGFMEKAIAGAGVKKLIAYEIFKEIPGEIGANLWQNFNEWQNVNPDKPLKDFVSEQPAAVAQTIVATIVGGSGQIGVAKLLETTLQRYAQEQQKTQEAQVNHMLITQMGDLSESSKLKARGDDVFQQFVTATTDGTPAQDLYISANALMQSGLAEQVAAVSPSVADQLTSALTSDGYVRIPTAEYAAKIAGSELNQGLIDHVKLDPNGYTFAESKEYQSTFNQELQTQLEQKLIEHNVDAGFRESQQAVHDDFLQQLNDTKRFTEETNKAYAGLLSNFYAVTAAKLGMTPQDLVQRYKLGVTSKVTGQAQFNQDGQLKTDTPNFKNWFGESKVVDDHGHPLVMYHATHKSFDTFAKSFRGAFFVTPSADFANDFIDEQANDGDEENTNIMPLYVKAENTFDYENPEHVNRVIEYLHKTNLFKGVQTGFFDGGRWDSIEDRSVQKAIKALGFDSFYVNENDTKNLAVYNQNQLKSAIGNNGEFDPSNPNILNQSGTEGFKQWTHGHEVIDIGESHEYKAGEGVVVQVVHGTTGDFDTFEKDKANIESDLGGGFYFTNNVNDVGENYAGLGPDLTNKIERRAEQLFDELGEDERERIVEEATGKKWKDLSYEEKRMPLKAMAREELSSENEGFSMPVFVRFDNPVVIGGSEETFIDYTEQYDEETEEYGEPEGKLVEFVEALRDVASEYSDADADGAMAAVFERVSDNEGIFVSELIELLSQSEGLQYATDDNGASASKEIIRRAFEQIGFDGYIDQTVNKKFGSEKRVGKPMAGMDEETVHFIAFNATQIKSRIGNNGEFSEDNPNILKQGDEARGQIMFGQDLTQTTSVIALLEKADLSTFVHETGHFFLQMQADLAMRIQSQKSAGGSITDGEQSIIDDMNQTLTWFGIESDMEGSALDRWSQMSIDEQRPYHEKWARGFEAYAFEGNAPTLELQSIFQKFSSWMLHVYKSLTQLNVELSDEVRGVMDRMLASREQIEAAEAARNMGPLFTAKNAEGLIDDWKAYHDLANESTQGAIDELQTKDLKNMQWLSRARTKILKEMQAKHDVLRMQTRMEVRREVMSQPVYRAWQFLTGKMSDEDKANFVVEKPKSGQTINPEVDSIFVAMAKLGGLDYAQVKSQWGWDDKERSPVPVFGKPVVRKKGGRGLDDMAELLASYGYLQTDEHGKHDLADLEEKFHEELRGAPQYSMSKDYSDQYHEQRAGEQADLDRLGAGRLDLTTLKFDMGLPREIVEHLVNLKMTAKEGLHPDIAAEHLQFSSGDEMVRTLAAAQPPKEVIENETDRLMLERYGDLTDAKQMQAAADKAVSGVLRDKMLQAEARALEKAMNVRASTGKTSANGAKQSYAVLPKVAREFAQRLVTRLKIRDIRPSQYAAAAAKNGKDAERAYNKGDIDGAAQAKRSQILNTYTTRAAYEVQEEMGKAIAYLRKFDKKSKSIDVDYYDQIVQMLERFDLVQSTSLKAIDKRTSLAGWLAAQEEAGIVPDIPPALAMESARMSYKNMTVEEMRGLRDTIKQLDHLGRLKSKLMNAADQRDFEAVRDEMVASIDAHSRGREAVNRTPNTVLGESLNSVKSFGAEHIKVATLARIMDGGVDGGPIWNFLIRPANHANNKEVSMRAEATQKLYELVAPILKEGKMGGKGMYFAGIGRSLNKEARIAMALNMGNESNMQRLLGGEGWTLDQVMPVFNSLTAADWNFVQAVWDHFESYRPEIAAKQRRVYGTEPNWLEAKPLIVKTSDGQTLDLRGGYYPVKYDPRASTKAGEHADAEEAKRMLQGAYTSATTRRSFTKERAEAVEGRPLLYSLDGMYSGVNEVIHDLCWHEWLIDTNRLVKNPKISDAIRSIYGVEVHNQFKSWIKDIAEGGRGAQNAGEKAAAWLRQGVSVAGLGINVMSALTQPFGITQSMVRIGADNTWRGISKFIADPVGLNDQICEMSEFMRHRGLTQMRELAELKNQVKGQSKFRSNMDSAAYALMMQTQRLVDLPTWWGAYEKATAEGHGDDQAIDLADQAVIDAQGDGSVSNLAAIERGGPALKLFTSFSSFPITALNLAVGQTMTRRSNTKMAADYLMIFVVPTILIALMKSAFTPGDSGDWDDPKSIGKKLGKELLSAMMGTIMGVREFIGVYDALAENPNSDYQGPAGVRLIPSTIKLAKEIGQGDMDDGLRKAIVNEAGYLLRLPAAQINRTITGAKALKEGKTHNPAALVFGYETKH